MHHSKVVASTKKINIIYLFFPISVVSFVIICTLDCNQADLLLVVVQTAAVGLRVE